MESGLTGHIFKAARWVLVLAVLLVWSQVAGAQTTSTLIWEDQGIPSTAPLPGEGVPFAPPTVGGVTYEWSLTDADGSVTQPTVAGLQDFATFFAGGFGGPAGNAIFVMSNADTNFADRIDYTMTFDGTVSDLSFSVLDLDVTGGNPEGLQIVFTDENGSVQNLADPAFSELVTFNPATTTLASFGAFGPGWQGVAGGTGTGADVGVDFGGQQVASVTISILSAEAGTVLSGLGDVSWVPLAADLSLEVFPSSVAPFFGGDVELTYTLQNDGIVSADGVTANLPLPSGLTFISDDSGGAYNPVTGVWTLPSPIAPGESQVISILAFVEDTGSFAVLGEVATSNTLDADSTPGNAASAPGEDDTVSLTLFPRLVSDQTIFCLGRQVSQLFFVGPQLTSGIDGAVGAVYLYQDVAPGIDAEVEITDIAGGATLGEFDDDIVNGLKENFQPLLIPTTTPGAEASVEFVFRFFIAGTRAPALLDFAASAIDVDGDGASLEEFVEFSDNLVEFALNDPTSLAVGASGPTVPGNIRFEAVSAAAAPGIDPTAAENIVTTFFTDKSAYTYRIGAIDTSATTRLTSLAFNCPTLLTPAPSPAAEEDFGDAPISFGNPVHTIAPSVLLGTVNTSEEGPFDSPVADGDPGDDGASLPAFVAGEGASFDVSVTGAGGFLQAWVDWNGNGTFADAGEQIATDVQDTDDDGIITLNITAPIEAAAGPSFTRLRWSLAASVDPGEAAGDGEVEDYQVAVTPRTPIFAGDDAATITLADTGVILNVFIDNGAGADVLDGNPAATLTAGTDFNVIFDPVDLPAGILFDTISGDVSLDTSTPPEAGTTVSFPYQFCEGTAAINCKTATVTITILAPLPPGSVSVVAIENCEAQTTLDWDAVDWVAGDTTDTFTFGLVDFTVNISAASAFATGRPDDVNVHIDKAGSFGDSEELHIETLAGGALSVVLSLSAPGQLNVSFYDLDGGEGGVFTATDAAGDPVALEVEPVNPAGGIVTITGSGTNAVTVNSSSANATTTENLAHLNIKTLGPALSIQFVGDVDVDDYFFGISDISACGVLLGGELRGSKTAEIFDPNNEGLFSIPGNDVLYTISVANIGETPTDADTIFIVDSLPSEVDFFNGDVDGPDLPETGPIAFESTSTGLSFDMASDLGFSDQLVAPTNFSECTYVPQPGIDPAVRFICFNPSGSLEADEPDPSFAVSFRARIR